MSHTRAATRTALVVAALAMPLASTASADTFQSVMQGLAKDMNRVQSALFIEDFATATEAAERSQTTRNPPWASDGVSCRPLATGSASSAGWISRCTTPPNSSPMQHGSRTWTGPSATTADW